MKKIVNILSLFLALILGVLAPIGTTIAMEGGGDTETINDEIPELYIKAVNPGYTTEFGKDVGEMIEIARKNTDAPLSLARTAVRYTNTSGKESVLLEFPENSLMYGERILLRLASSLDSELANITYTTRLAMNAELKLVVDGEVVDEVCWTGKEGCNKKFDSKKPTTLVRDLETGDWLHLEEYEPDYDPDSYYAPDSEQEPGKGGIDGDLENAPKCRGIQFSEILGYYENSKAEQFVELYNPGVEEVQLDGCVIKYKNKNHELTGKIIAEGYFAYYPEQHGFALTKNPTSVNELKLIDADGTEVDKLDYPNGQRKGTSYAWIGHDEVGEEIWKVTYAPTPGEANNYQEFRSCEVGKVLNQATGNCVKATSLAVKTCKEGYFLNTLTGRCNKVKTEEEKSCKEGYYRDSETNRCRKIKENKGADYELAPAEYEESSSFVAVYAVIGVIIAGGGYLIYEFRHDIGKWWRRIGGRVFRRR